MTRHPYSDRPAFERLLLLIATFVQYPGVGSPDPLHSTHEKQHQALIDVQAKLLDVAQTYNIDLPSYSLGTLRKDLETLRKYGILDRRMYRWGYYLGTGAFTHDELRTVFQSLKAQAHSQGHPHIRALYQSLERRLRGLNLDSQGQFFYPVRTQLNRAIVHTDPEEMMSQGENRHTLFHHLNSLEDAILQGQAIELYRFKNPYKTNPIGTLRIFPLQLVYSDIAWYLLYEYCDTQHLEIERVDRFNDSLTPLPMSPRGAIAQTESLNIAHQLLSNGWGLYLGQPDEQRLERAGQQELITVKVRFFPAVMNFILEGEKRHNTQKLRLGAKTPQGNVPYLDYTVALPPRSINEFSRWVCRFMDQAQFISPPELLENHQQAAKRLIQRYS
jgi:predicted DNA-binding transcriptional regulator YafY